ncbi:hypothetical protein [Roseateles sp. P5_E7]
MSTADLFPETAAGKAPAVQWIGPSRCKWEHPRVVARLVPSWSAQDGWRIGWFIQADKCVDEWHPDAPNKHKQHGAYPWYRLDELPNSPRFAMAAGSAARALKIVLEQMVGHVEPEIHDEIRSLQEQIERQAQDWLCGRAA